MVILKGNNWEEKPKYRTDAECRYYASDLNKYASKLNIELNGKRTITINNIDCIFFKIMQGGKWRIRLIESKHKEESYGSYQKYILEKLSEFFETYTLTGNAPYDDGAEIYNHKTKESKNVSKNELTNFLEFKTEFNQLNEGRGPDYPLANY
jgi:hypothetical protein